MDRLRSRDTHDGPRPRSRFSGAGAAPLATRLLLIVALAASSIVLAQCRVVGDNVTGIQAELLRRKNECTATCQDDFKACQKSAEHDYGQEVQACNGDPACIEAAASRIAAEERRCKDARDVCMAACEHQQGGGTVGP